MSDQYPHHDKEWLMEHLAELEDMGEVADEAGVSPGTIERWIDRHGIQAETEQPIDAESGDGTVEDSEDGDLGNGEAVSSGDGESRSDSSGDSTEDATQLSQVDATTHPTAEATEVERDQILQKDVETEEVVIDPDAEDNDPFPEDADIAGFGTCECCGREELRRNHSVTAADDVAVCHDCWQFLLPKNINTTRTILANPTSPEWSVNDE